MELGPPEKIQNSFVGGIIIISVSGADLELNTWGGALSVCGQF